MHCCFFWRPSRKKNLYLHPRTDFQQTEKNVIRYAKPIGPGILLFRILFSLSSLFFPFLYLLLFSLFLLSDRLTSVARMRSDRHYVQYIRGSLSWVASGRVGFSRRE